MSASEIIVANIKKYRFTTTTSQRVFRFYVDVIADYVQIACLDIFFGTCENLMPVKERFASGENDWLIKRNGLCRQNF
jgi:hypothetical protein